MWVIVGDAVADVVDVAVVVVVAVADVASEAINYYSFIDENRERKLAVSSRKDI